MNLRLFCFVIGAIVIALVTVTVLEYPILTGQIGDGEDPFGGNDLEEGCQPTDACQVNADCFNVKIGECGSFTTCDTEICECATPTPDDCECIKPDGSSGVCTDNFVCDNTQTGAECGVISCDPPRSLNAATGACECPDFGYWDGKTCCARGSACFCEQYPHSSACCTSGDGIDPNCTDTFCSTVGTNAENCGYGVCCKTCADDPDDYRQCLDDCNGVESCIQTCRENKFHCASGTISGETGGDGDTGGIGGDLCPICPSDYCEYCYPQGLPSLGNCSCKCDFAPNHIPPGSSPNYCYGDTSGTAGTDGDTGADTGGGNSSTSSQSSSVSNTSSQSALARSSTSSQIRCESDADCPPWSCNSCGDVDPCIYGCTVWTCASNGYCGVGDAIFTCGGDECTNASSQSSSSSSVFCTVSCSEDDCQDLTSDGFEFKECRDCLCWYDPILSSSSSSLSLSLSSSISSVSSSNISLSSVSSSIAFSSLLSSQASSQSSLQSSLQSSSQSSSLSSSQASSQSSLQASSQSSIAESQESSRLSVVSSSSALSLNSSTTTTSVSRASSTVSSGFSSFSFSFSAETSSSRTTSASSLVSSSSSIQSSLVLTLSIGSESSTDSGGDDDDDGDSCFNDDECQGDLLCINNECRPGCRNNNDCPIGVCLRGVCVPCASDSECPGNRCVNNQCLPCESDGHCPDNLVCRQGVCRDDRILVASAEICGNGVLDVGEECDDSNRRDDDGCTSSCLLEFGICGDGIVQKLLGEQCEPVIHSSSLPYDCVSCRFLSRSCGDGVLDPGEECDDGTQNSTSPDAHCRPDCSLGRCGDAVLDSNEECEDGNRLNGDGCDRYCTKDTTAVAADQDRQDITFPQDLSRIRADAMHIAYPQYPVSSQLPFQYQLPLAQLQPLIQSRGPVGDTGPAAVAVVGAGAAAGWSWIKRRRR